MRSLVLLSLVSCSPEELREIDVFGSPGDGSGGAPEIWEPPVDTGAGSLEDQWAAQASFECGALSAEEPTTGDDLLEVSWCSRMSPEGDELDGLSGSEDTGEEGPLGPSGPGEAPPPCGFYNLVGAVDLAWVSEGPDAPAATLYCDSDLGGGVRLARYVPGSDELQTLLVSEDDCLADVDTGLVLPQPSEDDDGGLRLVWSSLDGVVTATVDGAGNLTEEPRVFEGLERPWRLRLHEHRTASGGGEEDKGGASIWVVDLDRNLHLLDVDFGTGALQTSQILSGVETFDATRVGEDSVVVGCPGVDEAPTVTRVAASGEIQWTETLAEATCGWDTRPSVAEGEGTLLVAWDDGDNSSLHWLVDGSEAPGGDLGRMVLPDSGRHTQARWDGERFVVLEGSGRFVTYDAEATELGTWTQPMLADRSGHLWGQRLVVDEERWTVVQLAQDLFNTDIGHLYTFYYVEATSSPAP